MGKCADCPYYWKEDYEDYPFCHWVSRCGDDHPPCEEPVFETYWDDEDDAYYDEEN